ncbi:hypothetical protein D3C79_649670 [compost metagenome]
MASGEDFIQVLLDGPRCAHPPTRHLIDDNIGPEKLFYFFSIVVTTVDVGGFDVETGAVKKRQRGLVQGFVQTTIGVGEFLTTVEQQDLFHGVPHLGSIRGLSACDRVNLMAAE